MSDAIEIRDLRTHAEYDACVALQRETWGQNFSDTVPASILHVTQRLGGVAAGAFDSTGRLVGFVFGITGVEDGEIVHWSDMLAVRPEVRNCGVGRRLKEFQRLSVARLGARVIYWTFDPLVARNAHLNFNVFGVRAVEYVRDMYGDATGSDLHVGIGTDRLIVAWPVDEAELSAQKRRASEARLNGRFASAPVVGEPGAAPVDPAKLETRARIMVPGDIAQLQGSDLRSAVQWRTSTRTAFQSLLAAGFRIDGFELDAKRRLGHYLLSRAD